MKYLTRTIWLLSLVSLFNDVASEMLVPVMPFFLKSIGFSVLLIGILEGLAEAVAGLSKGYFGRLSDSKGRRLIFVQAGYALSAAAKPVMAVLARPFWVFLARTSDRFGKGLRTGARDAMLSDASEPAVRGRVFGFHRSMDTLGAVFGPAIALIFLAYYPGQYKQLFMLAFLPGIVAVSTTFLLKEKGHRTSSQPVRFFSFLSYWNQSPSAYRKLVIGLLIFALVNSSDLFLLLRTKDFGLSERQVILVYIFYNLVYAFLSFPMGILADRLGLKTIFIFGLFLFAAAYGGMAMSNSMGVVFVLFFVYAWSVACFEGISKAWITSVTEKKDTGTAIGMFTAFQSLCAMGASTLTGLLWFRFGAGTAFLFSAGTAIAVAIYFSWVPGPKGAN